MHRGSRLVLFGPAALRAPSRDCDGPRGQGASAAGPSTPSVATGRPAWLPLTMDQLETSTFSRCSATSGGDRRPIEAVESRLHSSRRLQCVAAVRSYELG